MREIPFKKIKNIRRHRVPFPNRPLGMEKFSFWTINENRDRARDDALKDNGSNFTRKFEVD